MLTAKSRPVENFAAMGIGRRSIRLALLNSGDTGGRRRVSDMKMVQDAQGSKAPSARLADVVAVLPDRNLHRRRDLVLWFYRRPQTSLHTSLVNFVSS